MTTYVEFTYDCEEWQFPKGDLRFHLELVLSADKQRDIVDGIHLEAVRWFVEPLDIMGRLNRKPVPLWLSDAMTAWVRDNQAALEVVRREHFAEAAE